MISLALIFSSSLALIFIYLFLNHRNKLKSSTKELDETKNRLQIQVKDLELISKEKKRLATKIDKFLKQEKEFFASKKKFFVEVQELNQKLKTLTETYDKRSLQAKNQIEHYQKNSQSLETKLVEAESELSSQEAEFKRVEALSQDLSKQNPEGLKAQIKDLKYKLKQGLQEKEDLSNDLKRLSKKLEVLNPQVFERTKKRLSQSEQLYIILKGQKDLVEERSRYWEKGLRLLSLAVLDEKKPKLERPEKLGELVTEALDSFNLASILSMKKRPRKKVKSSVNVQSSEKKNSSLVKVEKEKEKEKEKEVTKLPLDQPLSDV